MNKHLWGFITMSSTLKLKDLLPFTKTDKERQIIDALCSNKTQEKAASSIGLSRRQLQELLYKIKKRSNIQGTNTLGGAVEEPFYVKGVSSLYDASGNVKMQWVKTNTKAEALSEIANEIIESLKEDIPKNTLKTKKLNHHVNSDLLNLHVISDYHLGMFAWGEQNYDTDWNTDKSEEFLVEWFKQSLLNSPNAETGVMLNLGDFLTSDSVAPVTPSHGHLLDVDKPFQYIIRTAIRVYRQLVELMKQKYEKVVIISVSGNHDLTSGMWLREFFKAFYENDDRVVVDDSPDSYHYLEHGDVSLFFHHGHRRKVSNVSEVFISKFRDVYGRTKMSYAHLGHRHSIDVKESSTMVVEQHRTLCPQDQYASGGGWMSGRSSYVITYHKKYGEVGRNNISSCLVEIGK
jgi:hypothetical protein